MEAVFAACCMEAVCAAYLSAYYNVPTVGPAGLKEILRNLRALAAASLANNDDGAVILEEVQYMQSIGVNRKPLPLRRQRKVLQFVHHYVALLIRNPLNVYPRPLCSWLPHRHFFLGQEKKKQCFSL